MGIACIAALSGQCLIYSAGADPPPVSLTPDNQTSALNSNDLSNPPSRSTAPALRFKKEDFVPIPEMAPMPLDNPDAPQRKPLKVTIPNLNEVRQAPQVHQAMVAPANPDNDSDNASAATTPKKKGFFGRLAAHFTSDESDDTTEKTKPVASKPQPVARPATTMARRSNFPETPIPNGTVQAAPLAAISTQDLTPPPRQITPLLGTAPAQPYGSLSPAAGAAAASDTANASATPLIPLADAPPPPAQPKPSVPAEEPLPAKDSTVLLSSGEPLIALPGSTSPASATTTAQAQPAPKPAKAPAPIEAVTIPPVVPATAAAAPPPQPVALAEATKSQPVAPAQAASPPIIAATTPDTTPPISLPVTAAATPTATPAPTLPPAAAPAIAQAEAPLPAAAPAVARAEAPPAPAQPATTPAHPVTVAARHTAPSQPATATQTAPPPKALASSMWDTQKPTAPAAPVQAAAAQVPAPLPWQAATAPLPPVNPATYGASALPPQPTIVAGPVAPPILPANVPAYAVQHWSGPNAVPETAANTLPASDLPPTPAANEQWTEPAYTPPPASAPAQQPAPMPVQMAAQTQPPAPPQPPRQPLPARAFSAQQMPKPATPLLAAAAAPAADTMEDTTEPQRSLSPASKQIVHNLTIPKAKPNGPTRPVFIEHARDLASLDQPVAAAGTAITPEAKGVKIEIKPPAINFDYELEKAYNALIAGQSEVAIATYKNVLDNDPNNKNALFGLATTYHRAGQIELARSMYSRLLTIDPNNSDGLNNFLVLLADEAPEEALVELQKLAERNPQYSALPAQIAVIYQKLGQYDKAGQYMFQAIEMAPENITYRYNFAIMLDKQHKYDEAAKLYKQLIQAYQRGETIPGNVQKIQQRLTFISSNRPS